MSPSTIAELAETVRTAERLPIPLLEPGDGLSFASLQGQICHEAADGVVSCLAGTTLRELNDALSKDQRVIPHASVWPENADDLSLAALILLGLPHVAEGSHGTWRDWILGTTMVTAEGSVVKGGSRVVKSVAGYDAHKLLIGSRGTLLIPAEITLRTFHISAITYPHPVHSLGDKVRSIMRVRITDMRNALELLGQHVLFSDPKTGTLWTSRSVQDLPSIPYAWTINPFHPTIPDSLLPIHRCAKEILDPTGKLAPAAFSNL